jgi:hypothetical protein
VLLPLLLLPEHLRPVIMPKLLPVLLLPEHLLPVLLALLLLPCTCCQAARSPGASASAAGASAAAAAASASRALSSLPIATHMEHKNLYLLHHEAHENTGIRYVFSFDFLKVAACRRHHHQR